MAIVTISRGSGSGGQRLAARLAETLGYGLVSREDVVKAATAYGVPGEKLREALVAAPGFWDRFKHERRRYLAVVQAGLCERVQGDRVVYHGNAGHLLLHGVSHVACVRLIAPMQARAKVVMEREGVVSDEAVRLLEEVDAERKNWTSFLYGVDWLDPNLYDLTINLRTLSLEGAVRVAAEAVQRDEFEPTEESRKAMQDLLVASRVRAALATDEVTGTADVEVRADDGVVHLKGKLRQSGLADAIIQVTQTVEGVSAVNREQLGTPDLLV
jgi:cytidylate kinase